MNKLLPEQISGINKLVNSEIILGTYPEIDRIELKEWMDRYLICRIFLKDSDITSENMYQKGIDPHYLIDIKINEYLPYYGIDEYVIKGFVVFAPTKSGYINISDFFHI